MDSTSPRRSQNQNQTLLPSPPHNTTHSSNSNSSSSSSSNTNRNALHSNNNNTHQQQLPPLSPTAPKPTTTTTTRSESTPTLYPTTFVQADSSSFKQVVQMLTGSSETSRQATSSYCNNPSSITKSSNYYNPTSSENISIGLPSKNHHMIPPIQTMPTKQHYQPGGYRLYQRRNNLNIIPLQPSPVFSLNPSSSGFSLRNHADVPSPSILGFPSLVLSPVTPLLPDPFGRSGSGVATGYHYYGGNGCPILDTVAEEKAIKEKGFFLHPSPRATTPRDTEPRLLPLFPTTSPKAEGAESSSF